MPSLLFEPDGHDRARTHGSGLRANEVEWGRQAHMVEAHENAGRATHVWHGVEPSVAEASPWHAHAQSARPGERPRRTHCMQARRVAPLRSSARVCLSEDRTDQCGSREATKRPPLWSENQLCTFVCPLRLCLDHAFTLHNMIAQQYTTSGHFEHLFLPVSNR